jgi:hypothetical protein
VGEGGGTTFRINEFAPGSMRFEHRTETMDYVLHSSGEIDCELENGEFVQMKLGDVMIQRGTIHTRANRGAVPAVIAFILTDAKPVEVNGKEMRTFFPVSDGSQGVKEDRSSLRLDLPPHEKSPGP